MRSKVSDSDASLLHEDTRGTAGRHERLHHNRGTGGSKDHDDHHDIAAASGEGSRSRPAAGTDDRPPRMRRQRSNSAPEEYQALTARKSRSHGEEHASWGMDAIREGPRNNEGSQGQYQRAPGGLRGSAGSSSLLGKPWLTGGSSSQLGSGAMTSATLASRDELHHLATGAVSQTIEEDAAAEQQPDGDDGGRRTRGEDDPDARAYADGRAQGTQGTRSQASDGRQSADLLLGDGAAGGFYEHLLSKPRSRASMALARTGSGRNSMPSLHHAGLDREAVRALAVASAAGSAVGEGSSGATGKRSGGVASGAARRVGTAGSRDKRASLPSSAVPHGVRAVEGAVDASGDIAKPAADASGEGTGASSGSADRVSGNKGQGEGTEAS